eukprot:CAMPEP_0185762920 /NCGR_PEP_ID=MMETSP1174-20130828/21891_1 /TAXON_ID=35687 /ORGANISM="Dictyocha speculum, Strain CCMP1381" /LENGTH=333 /DNA_ID=CAMNT_0028444809 /DNA_START=23 /DNA_END=1025 /DNA_ORIENTATION=+
MRFADTGNVGDPIVFFLHGWPESWFSWRHQLKACAKKGWRGIAPDLRGYGSTDAPEEMAAYNIYSLAGDVLGLLTALGGTQCMLVGHDHGANLAWKLALLHPNVFRSLCAMSVPYAGRDRRLSFKLSGGAMATRLIQLAPVFFYMLHHNLHESATAGYAANTREALYRLYAFQPGCVCESPEIISEAMYVDGEAVGVWARIPRPKSLPPWLPRDDFEYCVREYERAGWGGGLRWYQTFDLDWEITPQLKDLKLTQPVLFLAGEADPVIKNFGGSARAEEGMKAVCAAGYEGVFYPQKGHWIQQESPQEVNNALFNFMETHRGRVLSTPPVSCL